MGAYHALAQELRETDSRGFANFLRMDVGSFEILLRTVAPLIARQDTLLRLSIQPEERLALTLRWLATGIRPVLLHNSGCATRGPLLRLQSECQRERPA